MEDASGRRGVTTLVVRRGTADDLPFVRDLGVRSMPETASAVRPAPADAIAKSFENTLGVVLAQRHTLLIAEDGREPLGFIVGLDNIPDDTTGLSQAFYVFMAVEPHARRRGVARLLMRAAEDAVRASGVPYMAFAVTEDNVAARDLYAQLGFVTERRLLCKRV